MRRRKPTPNPKTSPMSETGGCKGDDHCFRAGSERFLAFRGFAGFAGFAGLVAA
jgi:hypothetical protein